MLTSNSDIFDSLDSHIMQENLSIQSHVSETESTSQISKLKVVVVYSLHIVFGTESWLRPEISNSEIFSSNYQIFRQDREDGYGGVFYRFLACQQMTLNSNCEMVACNLHFQAINKSLIVASMYRPPNRDQEYAHHM